MMTAGMVVWIRAPLMAVVVCTGHVEQGVEAGDAEQGKEQQDFPSGDGRFPIPFDVAGQVRGSRIRKATAHRQKASAAGGISAATPLARTMLPAQHIGATATSKNAERGESCLAAIFLFRWMNAKCRINRGRQTYRLLPETTIIGNTAFDVR
jgi:hypothetical protein